jgi:arylsulfate sulfotransferase
MLRSFPSRERHGRHVHTSHSPVHLLSGPFVKLCPATWVNPENIHIFTLGRYGLKNSYFVLCFLLMSLMLVLGCGSSTNSSVSDFALSATPTLIFVTDDGPSQPITVAATAAGDFKGAISVTVSGLPAGVTASPSTISIMPGQSGQILLTASNAAVTPSVPITLTATSGELTHSTTAALAVRPGKTAATLSASSFDFGGSLVGSVRTKQVVTVTNTGSFYLKLNPTLTGDPAFALVPANSCGAVLAPGTSCTETVSYAPTTASGTIPQISNLNLGLDNVSADNPQTVTLSGLSVVLPAGTVTATNNPQVALYTMTLPYPGSIVVNFGTDTTYGRSTWSQSTSVAGGRISMLVAGMLPNATYHMQATVQLSDGGNVSDVDHTFVSGAAPIAPNLSVTTTPGMTPQPGVEELTFLGGLTGLVVTDLQGNILWSYVLPSNAGVTVQGAKLLPNGDFLLSLGESSAQSLVGPTNTTGNVSIREIDLAGNIVREISINDLNAKLQGAGYSFTLQEFHHDITPLPNGHWLVLSNIVRSFTDLPGYPGVTNVLGDVVIDVDENLQPVWVWNEFDHLDVNRHPMQFPDWTHTNAVVYSPSDGNIIVSMRHQNWVVKVDYRDGAGTGNILWHLGEGGDFMLQGGVDPTDWQYAQHYPSLFSPNSSGNFKLGVMDNGDDRIFPTGVNCGTAGAPACLYSTIPVFQIDEGAKTATLIFHQILPTSLYSYFGGNTELLANGNVEYDLAGVGADSDIFEVTPTATPATVWHMHSTASNAYRGYRIPSLYPGVQW